MCPLHGLLELFITFASLKGCLWWIQSWDDGGSSLWCSFPDFSKFIDGMCVLCSLLLTGACFWHSALFTLSYFEQSGNRYREIIDYEHQWKLILFHAVFVSCKISFLITYSTLASFAFPFLQFLLPYLFGQQNLLHVFLTTFSAVALRLPISSHRKKVTSAKCDKICRDVEKRAKPTCLIVFNR